MDTLRRILSELKQRHVIRVAGVYAVTTWGIFQVANNLFPALGLPRWTVTLVAVLLMLGFPVAIVLAWALEKTPEGIKRAAPRGEAAPARLAVMDWVLVAATAAVVGVSLAQMAGVGRALRTAPPAAGRVAAVSNKSIAVLPFVSFSDVKDAEFFADGLTEEVINSLAQIPDLKVAGRTSAFYFKGRNVDLREVGAKLGVAHVLEGSVRRDGERIRVTAQLIKVSDGFHLWSETYDRRIDDALAVQTEIANTVAGVLKTKLMTAPSAASASPESYRLAITARGQMRRLGLQNLTGARAMFQRAIALDPGNADAYAGLAQASMLLAQNHLEIEFDPARRASETAIRQALAIDPNSVQAHIAAGTLNTITMIRVGDVNSAGRAEAAFKRALQLDPKNPDALTYYGNLLNHLGRSGEALPLLKRATELDPLNRVALNSLAAAYVNENKIEEATRTYRSVAALYPDFIDAKQALGSMLASRGRFAEAEPYLRQAAAQQTDPSAAIELTYVYLNLDMMDDARRTMAAVTKPPTAVAIFKAARLMVDNDVPGLMAFSEKQYARDKDPFWVTAIGHAALLAGDNRRAIAQAQLVVPELLGPNPPVRLENLDATLGVAHALNGIGLRDQARVLLDRALAATAPKAGEFQPHQRRLRRVQALAELGETQRALAELRAAIRDGFRNYWDMEAFIPLDRDPSLVSLRGDAQFQAMLAEIRAANARQREQLLAARAGGARRAG